MANTSNKLGTPCRKDSRVWCDSGVCDAMYCAWQVEQQRTQDFAKSRPGEGVKLDAGKIDPTFVTEYFPHALLAVSAVAGYGARKYTRGGWRTVDNGVQRYTAAMLRHLLAERNSAYDTEDSGLAHAAQVAWNALARLQFMLESGTLEIQSGNDIADGRPVLGTSKKIA